MIYEVPKIASNFNDEIKKLISQNITQLFQLLRTGPSIRQSLVPTCTRFCISASKVFRSLLFSGHISRKGSATRPTNHISLGCIQIKCSAIMSPNKLFKHSQTRNDPEHQLIEKNSRSKRRTPEYPVVQYCGVTTSIFLFPCLEIAIGKRQGHFMDELLMGEKNKPPRNTQLGQMCASLSSCKKEEFQSCD